MPLYEYECESCGKVIEKVYNIASYPQTIKCECGKRAKKLCAVGGIQDDHPTWIGSTNDGLVDPDLVKAKQEKPIESRADLNRALKEKGLVQVG